MTDWALAAALGGALIAALTFGHRVVSQLLGRIDALGGLLSGEMERRFDEMEQRRQEGSALWKERLDLRDQAIAELRRDHETLRTDLCASYVTREAYADREYRTFLTLEKIREVLGRINSGLGGDGIASDPPPPMPRHPRAPHD